MSPILFEYGPLRIGRLRHNARRGIAFCIVGAQTRISAAGTRSRAVGPHCVCRDDRRHCGSKFFTFSNIPTSLSPILLARFFPRWVGRGMAGFWAAQSLCSSRFAGTTPWIGPLWTPLRRPLVVGYFFGRGGCELSGDGCYARPLICRGAKRIPRALCPRLKLCIPRRFTK